MNSLLHSKLPLPHGWISQIIESINKQTTRSEVKVVRCTTKFSSMETIFTLCIKQLFRQTFIGDKLALPHGCRSENICSITESCMQCTHKTKYIVCTHTDTLGTCRVHR